MINNVVIASRARQQVTENRESAVTIGGYVTRRRVVDFDTYEKGTGEGGLRTTYRLRVLRGCHI